MTAERQSSTPQSACSAARPRDGGYKWVVVGVFWCIYFLNQADRQVIFSVFPLLQQELGLTNTQLGLLGSSFQWVYGTLVPLAGWLGDSFSRRSLIVLALLVWSAATFSSGLAVGFGLLLVLRALTGAGEAIYYPSAASIIGDYHGPKTRATALSIHQTSVYVGIVCSGALAGYVGQHYGWRVAFLAFGAAGILLALFAWKAIREPVRGQAENGAAEAADVMPLRQRLAEIFANRSAVSLMLAFLGMNFVNVACLTWTPTLLYQKFSMSLAEAGFHATFYHHAGAFAGVLLGGKLADHWSQRSVLSRPLIQLSGLILAAPFIVLLGRSDSVWVVCAALGLFGLFRGLYDSNLFASLYEVIRPEARATATGAMLAIAFLGGGSAALAVGWLSRGIGLGPALSATAVFYGLAAAVLLAASVFWFRQDAARMHGGGQTCG
jgi:predicted MFS family arabinose efflux permease